MPNVTIESPNNVTIDGVSAGKLVDSVINHPSRTAEIHAAMDAWVAEQNTKLEAAETRVENITKLAQQAANAIRDGDPEKATRKLADATKSKRDQRLERLRAEKARIEADIAVEELPIEDSGAITP